MDSFFGLYGEAETRNKIFDSADPKDVKLPLIHAHYFHKHEPHLLETSDEVVFENLRQRVSGKLNCDITLESLSFTI